MSAAIGMDSHSLTPADTLRSLRDDIQVEDTLVANRVTRYVTSQAFQLSDYATSRKAGFLWQAFFRRGESTQPKDRSHPCAESAGGRVGRPI